MSPTSAPTPTLRGRRLGSRLKHLRLTADKTLQDVVAELADSGKWSETKLSRIENGLLKKVRPADLSALCDLYGADDATREDLVRLSRMSSQRGTWLSGFNDVSDVNYSQYLYLERDANSVFEFGNIIPGLLQTYDYAYSLMEPSASTGSNNGTVQSRVELRMMRKTLLEGANPLRLWSVMDEAAIRRVIGGPAVMKEQLEDLLDASERPNINFQIIPFGVGAYPSSGVPFTILDFEDHLLPTVLYLEHSSYSIYEEDEQVLQKFQLRAELTRATALSVPESQAFVKKAIKELT